MIRAGLILLVTVLSASAGLAESQPTTAPTETSSDQTPSFRQAYREGFQPPEDADTEMKRMRKLIDKINQTALPDYRSKPITQQARMTPEVAAPVATPKTKPAAKVQDAPPDVLSTETLKELAQRVPESVADPIRLGDALYRSGHRDQALFIYRNAMAETRDPEDQLWLNYQMGCCLKDTEPAEARKLFQQVRSTAPDSPWAELADIQLQLADWMERNQPTQFLDDLRRDLSSRDERIDASRQTQTRTGEETNPTGSGTLGLPAEAPATQPAEETQATNSAPAEDAAEEPTTVSRAENKE